MSWNEYLPVLKQLLIDLHDEAERRIELLESLHTPEDGWEEGENYTRIKIVEGLMDNLMDQVDQLSMHYSSKCAACDGHGIAGQSKSCVTCGGSGRIPG